MPHRPSPTVRARRLRMELSRLRQESGHTLQQVARASNSAFNASTVGRWETGDRVPRQGDLRVLLDIYGVHGERREALEKLAREAKQRGWWHPHRDMLKAGFGLYLGLEAEAATLSTFQAQLIPGLLQTPAYTRATVRALLQEGWDHSDQVIEMRKVRQERLTSDDPLTLWVVLDEAVLRRRIGGAAVMREQLNHLREAAKLPNVTLQVITNDAGAHAGLQGSFYMLDFPDPLDPGVVYLEQAMGGLALEGEDEIRRYTLMFGNLTAMALSPEESVDYFAQVAAELQ
ncbi:helix-turn-helix domain-containing protein [Spirillospora sp. NPDC127200]